MKPAFRFLFAIAAALSLFCLSASALEAAELSSGTAILLDAETGQVLFDKEKDRQVYPASTTKIMTAILVLEHCALDEVVTVSRSALDIDEWDSANIGLAVGEELTVDDALYALMLPSANDMANALAEHVAGTREAFALLMNEKAAALGIHNTSFTNAHGLPDREHYTTAHDMALITSYAMQNDAFTRYFGADEHVIPPTNRDPVPRELRNYQEMLLPGSSFYDPSVLGGKVGYTGQAGHTMSTVAEKYGRTLVAVVMQSGRSEKFHDTAVLLRHGFEGFQAASLPASFFSAERIPQLEGGAGGAPVEFYADEPFRFLLRNDLSVDDVTVDYRLPRPDDPNAELAAFADVRIGDVPLGAVTLRHRAGAGSKLPSWITHPPENHSEPNDSLMLAVILLTVSAAFLLIRIIALLRGRGRRAATSPSKAGRSPRQAVSRRHSR